MNTEYPTPNTQHPSAATWLRAVGLMAALTFCAYRGSLDNDFAGWDDATYVTDNPAVTGFSLPLAFTTIRVGTYAPLQILSYMLDHALWGFEPYGFHLTNLLLHALNAVLVCVVVREIVGRAILVPLLAGLLFALHPVHVESVAWISERKDVLSTFFMLLSFRWFMRVAQSAAADSLHPEEGRQGCLRYAARGGGAAYWLSLGSFALALLSKPIAIVLPLLMAAYVLAFSRAWRRMAMPLAPFFALTVVFTFIGFCTQLVTGSVHPPHGGSLYSTALTMLRAAVSYLGLLLVPVNQSALYRPEPSTSALDPRVLAAVTVLVAALAAAVPAARRSRLALFCLLWMVIPLIPVSNLIPLAVVLADRYLYVPSIGFCVLAGLCVAALGAQGGGRWSVVGVRGQNTQHLIRRGGNTAEQQPASEVLRQRTAYALCCAALALLSALTAQRCMAWKGPVSLWTDALRKSVTNPQAHYNRGVFLADAGLDARAEKEYRKAVREKPDYLKALTNLGNLLGDRGDLDGAARLLESAVKQFPKELIVRYNLAVAYYRQGRFEKAAAEYEAALTLNPNHVDSHIALGHIYAERLPAPAKALPHLRRALELAPNHPQAPLVRQWLEKLEAKSAK
ncbi:MAG: tetratricopeptide repeat protein [Planctomycetes bacterium]|nr:tetratricopeptide repeat protein [Planctomycetota bacterium]